MIKAEQIKGAWRFFSALLMTGISYPLGRLLYGNKGIWLIGERPHQAQDNGYHFFRYLKKNHPERRCYYVIKKDSHQLEKVAAIGDVIYHGSWKHWLMYFGCEAVVTAHVRGPLPGSHWRYKELAVRHKQKNKKTVFLRHGITKSDMKGAYRERTRVDLYLCGAKPEYDYVRATCHYHENEVKYTGLARYDALHDFTVKKQILIMPTWRLWLVNKENDLAQSEYVKEWNKVIMDVKLINAAKQAGYQILFYPHSELQFACDLFRPVDDTVIIAREEEYDVQTLLKESALLITDYSSVFFDFAYMRKPVLFFQFDNDRFTSEHYQKGYFDYERDGFGQVAYTVSDLVGNAVEAIQNGLVLDEKYDKRIDRFFPLYDRKNCARIYDEIVKICEKKPNDTNKKTAKESDRK